MFIAFIFLIILSLMEVFPGHEENKLISDESHEQFYVSPFLFNNNSIHLNISWKQDFILDNYLGKEVYVEIRNANDEFIYSNYESVSDYNIIIPHLDNYDHFANILLGSVYKISIGLEETVVTESYEVPECVGNYCVCIRNKMNFIKLVNMEFLEGYVYRVNYRSENTSLEKGNYYITSVSYIKQSNNDSFDVSNLSYQKGAFDIPLEYLQNGETYKLIIEYVDFNNINPNCSYKSDLIFTVPLPSKNDNYLLIKKVSISILLFFTLMLLCIFVKWSIFSTKFLAEIKRLLCAENRGSPIIENLKKTSFSLPHQEVNTLYMPLEVLEDPFEFPRANIVIKDVLGVGAFGQVYYAKAYNLNGVFGYTMVAVKLLREGAPKEELADFQAEIKMLKKIGVHKNVVKFLGCVTKSQPYMTIMELVANGDLKEYLLKLREMWIKNKNKRRFFPDDMEEKSLITDEPTADTEYIKRFEPDMLTPLLKDIGSPPEPVLDHKELENFAFQIATGMAYLEKIPVVHRDLAARNILITKEKVLKISDFGMSRSGPYVNRNFKKVPLRWMAIEAIEEFKTDSRSDVWSFGVLLWEIGTLGAFPYEDIRNELILQALKSGIRLTRPEICTDHLYALMHSCWMENPEDRPTFQDIVQDFNTKKHVYVDFKRVNPNYVFPPTDPK